jgi:hypothetical protein
VLSVVQKTRNSSGSLYRCHRRSAYDRRRADAMLFLMKTLRARPSPNLIHAFRQNPLWMRSTALLSRCGMRHPRWVIWACRRNTNRARGPFGNSNPASQSCCYDKTLPPSFAAVFAPSLKILFPCVERRQG